MTHDVHIRVVSSSLPDLPGKTFAFTGEPIVIGRADDCTIVLGDARVSRHHARIEATDDGAQVIDTGSANGLWVGERQVAELSLTHLLRFSINDTVFEWVAPPPAPPVAPEAPPRPPADSTSLVDANPFLLRIVSSKAGEVPGREFRADAGVATIGREKDNTAVLVADRSVSRRHARITALGGGRFRVADAGSSYGVWIGDRRVTEEVIDAGHPFRIGDTVFECQEVPTEEPEAEGTRMMSGFGDLLARVAARSLETAGDAIPVSGSRTVTLDDPEWAYYVVAGKVEVFTVTIKDGRALGARNHFLTINPGEAFFGVDLRHARDSGFLAAGKSGTEVRRMHRDELRRLAADRDIAAQVVRLVDTWVTGMTSRLTRDIFPRPFAEAVVEPGRPATLAAGKLARGGAGVAWVEIDPGSLVYIGLSELLPDEPGTRFPVTAHCWIEPAGGQAAPLALAAIGTADLFADPSPWRHLDYFHQVLCECEFINKRLALVEEFQRLESKARQSEAAREAAMDAIGAVLAGRHTEPSEAAPSGPAEPIVDACRQVGQASGIRVVPPVDSRADRTFEDHVTAVAGASRFRTRRVVLRGEWWRRDQGPILARLEQTGAPIALIPKGPRAYVWIDPTARTRQPVTAALAAALAPFGYVFYRPFPTGALTVRDVVRFGAHGLGADFKTLLAMGLITGFLGAATPFLSGQMIDRAIPQGERGLLVQLGLGMLLAAAATASFRLTQSFAVSRVSSKMDYALQAALWDRLLDLPSGFFRKYGAGDLAERAAGINAIRGLVSRAGVGGILGSLSSAAYIVLMAFYSFKLTMVAVAITLVLVGVTTIGNFLQLRYQRVESAQRGLISSLVLQLIAGIAKVRVSASEHHAFRVWAQRFSSQKRTSFSSGTIQNMVGTASSSFNVLSSLGIFAMLYYMQLSAMPGEPPPFTTGAFVAFNSAFAAFVTAVQSLSDASLQLLQAVPVYERLAPILTTPAETDENKAAPGRLRGEIEVRNVSFRYHEDGPWILRNLSFKISPGEFVAFVGGSGCGKSTMMRLLLGFERPQQGAIYYDGQDLASLDTRAVRQQLGVVLQESRVLPTDIFRNIVGTTSHTMDEAWEAAEMGGLAEDIRQMPMGMHTVVSEGGGTFSGGQRQRLLIARALVNKPRVIYFDEATSALDNKSQAVVTHSMDRLDATRIVIAHRLSTIVNAHRILYFEGGEVREDGTYEALMAKGGLFAELAKRQIA